MSLDTLTTSREMPATRTAHQTKIEYDTAEAAFSDPFVGEKDAAFFTPKFRKEATPCISHPAATAPLKALGQNGHFPSVPSQTADAPRGFSLREKRSDQNRAAKQVWQLAGDDTQAGDTPL